VGWTLREIVATNPGIQLCVFLVSRRRTLRRVWRSIRRNVRHHGPIWLAWRTWQAVVTLLRSISSGSDYLSPWQLHEVARRYGFDVIPVTTLRAPEVLESVRQFEPELGVSISAPVVKRELFSLPTCGTINLHKGELPRYRGMPPAFWELWNGEESCGVAVHVVDEGLDTGPIVLEESIPIPRYPSLRGMELLLLFRGARLLAEAVRLTLSGEAAPRRQPDTGGKAYSSPRLAQEWLLRRRLRRRGPHVSRSLLAVLRSAARPVYVGTYLPLRHVARWIVGRVPAAILLYHRVNDDLRDDVTVGIESFESQVRTLRRRYRPATLESLLQSGERRSNRERLVVVTFDDGYEDNATVAAPILELYGMTGCFFLSTAMIGTDRAFPHDLRRLGHRVPAMSWRDVRRLVAAGHEVGSHTAHHVDLAQTDSEKMTDEMSQSTRAIQRQTGAHCRFFAFPFGKSRHTSQAARNCARSLGFVCYCWAAGGVNFFPLSPFELRRCGPHWTTSDDGFRAILEG